MKKLKIYALLFALIAITVFVTLQEPSQTESYALEQENVLIGDELSNTLYSSASNTTDGIKIVISTGKASNYMAKQVSNRLAELNQSYDLTLIDMVILDKLLTQCSNTDNLHTNQIYQAYKTQGSNAEVFKVDRYFNYGNSLQLESPDINGFNSKPNYSKPDYIKDMQIASIADAETYQE